MLDYCMPYFFVTYFLIFVTFLKMRPHMVTLRNVDGTILDYDLFYICTKFHSIPPQKYRNSGGGHNVPPSPLGPGRPQNSLGLKGLNSPLQTTM